MHTRFKCQNRFHTGRHGKTETWLKDLENGLNMYSDKTTEIEGDVGQLKSEVAMLWLKLDDLQGKQRRCNARIVRIKESQEQRRSGCYCHFRSYWALTSPRLWTKPTTAYDRHPVKEIPESYGGEISLLPRERNGVPEGCLHNPTDPSRQESEYFPRLHCCGG